MWKCAVCGFDCEEGLAVCPSCDTPKTVQTEVPDTTRPRFCPTCTRLLPAGETECRYCPADAVARAGEAASLPPPRMARTRDETIRRMQKLLRILAWVAVVVNVYRGLSSVLDYGLFRRVDFGHGTAWLSSSMLLSTLWEAAYSWIILMVIAEALGMLFAIEENTRRAAEGTGNRDRPTE